MDATMQIDLPIVRKFAPDAHQALNKLAAAVSDTVDPVICEIVRLRIAMLLGNPTELTRRPAGSVVSEEKLRELSNWDKSPLYSDAERACLDYAEQYVIDVTGVTDAHTNALLAHFDPSQIFAFVHAVYVLDGTQRTQLVFDRLLGDS